MIQDSAVGSKAAGEGKTFLSNMQILRFVAAAMVIIAHLIREANLKGLTDNTLKLIEALEMPWHTGVDIFFVISGFLMFHLSWNRFHVRGYWTEFLKRRFIRVVPLYWLFTIAFVLVVFLSPDLVQHSNITIGHVIASLFFIPWQRADGSTYPVLALGWTLNYEILFYLCFALVLGLRRQFAFATLVTVFCLASLFNIVAKPSLWLLKFWTDPIILEFIFGMVIARLYIGSYRLILPSRIACVTLGFMLLASTGLLGISSTEIRTSPLPRSVWAGLPCMLIVAGFMLGGQVAVRSGLSRFLILGGDASYALYLTHMFPIRALSFLWKSLELQSGTLFVIVGTIMALAVAIGVFLYIETPLLERVAQEFRASTKDGVDPEALTKLSWLHPPHRPGKVNESGGTAP